MKQLIVGLTGGIGSGKSLASDWFASQGIQIVDADIAARQVVEPGSQGLEAIADTFGSHFVQQDGMLNRRALRELIFQNPELRHQLEAITHPLIRESLEGQLADSQSTYTILVSPLLLETTQRELVERVLLIDAPAEIQIQRACARDQQTPDAIERIMAAQMSREQRRAYADDIVINDGDLANFYKQLKPLHIRYQGISHSFAP